MTAAPSNNAAPPLAKFLASTDKRTRDKAVKNLSIFLSDSQNVMTKPEMDKLWKGVFYCFWMSDKPLVQQALATELAELLLTITTTTSSLAFLRGFWSTTVREWNGIDRLRIDKYYMLVRRFSNATFRLLARTRWDSTACDEYNDILTSQGGPLCPTDNRVPHGLAYHLADIYLEELDKALGSFSSDTLPPSPIPLATVLAPFLGLAALTPTGTTYNRIQFALLEPLFTALTSSTTTHKDEQPSEKCPRLSSETASYSHLISHSCLNDATSEGNLDGVVLKQGLLRQLFDIAGSAETRDSNRRKMYAFWKIYADEDDEST